MGKETITGRELIRLGRKEMLHRFHADKLGKAPRIADGWVYNREADQWVNVLTKETMFKGGAVKGLANGGLLDHIAKYRSG